MEDELSIKLEELENCVTELSRRLELLEEQVENLADYVKSQQK